MILGRLRFSQSGEHADGVICCPTLDPSQAFTWRRCTIYGLRNGMNGLTNGPSWVLCQQTCFSSAIVCDDRFCSFLYLTEDPCFWMCHTRRRCANLYNTGYGTAPDKDRSSVHCCRYAFRQASEYVKGSIWPPHRKTGAMSLFSSNTQCAKVV